jgi:hypothetical protein
MPDAYSTPNSTGEFIKKNDTNPFESEAGEHARPEPEAQGVEKGAR